MTNVFTCIADGLVYANTAEGRDEYRSAYAGDNRAWCGGELRNFYSTPRAAALHALAGLETDDIETDEFGIVTLKTPDNDYYYSAEIGHGGDYTHTDEGGFLAFLNDDDWQDESWFNTGDLE